jgi:hypothetical protein
MTDHEDRIPPPDLEDVLNLGVDELELVRFRLEDERDSIQHQLEMDAVRRTEAEEEQDAYWVAKARHAVRCRITRIQQIGRILKLREEVA